MSGKKSKKYCYHCCASRQKSAFEIDSFDGIIITKRKITRYSHYKELKEEVAKKMNKENSEGVIIKSLTKL